MDPVRPILLNPATGKCQRTHIFVMTLCFSMHMYVEIVWDQKVKTWLKCHSNAFQWFGGIPRKITIDNLKSAITKACRYDPAVQRSYEDYARAYGFIISPCVPKTPNHKGRVEAGVKYVKRSFVLLQGESYRLKDKDKSLKDDSPAYTEAPEYEFQKVDEPLEFSKTDNADSMVMNADVNPGNVASKETDKSDMESDIDNVKV